MTRLFVKALLVVSSLCCISCCAIVVSTAGELIQIFADATTSPVNVDIEVVSDLDFSSALDLPLGAHSNGTCIPYSGTLRGNGHAIKNMHMNNKNREIEYNDAGLFCELQNAVIENLVIDSSCSFVGVYAGGLSVTLTGSVKVINVTNKATVHGDERVGGFIGHIAFMKQEHTELRAEDCVNKGSISNSGKRIGGFVGYIKSNNNLDVVISNFTNDAVIEGERLVGGLVGVIAGNTNTHITLSNCVNRGDISGGTTIGGLIGTIESNTNGSVVISNSRNMGMVNGTQSIGGFIGLFWGSTNVDMNILKCANDGDVIGSDVDVGGLVGNIECSNQTTMTISKFVNNGIVNGKNGFVGGFVGNINSLSPSSNFVFDIRSGTNKGSVSSTNGMACGLFCFDKSANGNVSPAVVNTINKGSEFRVCIWHRKHHRICKEYREHR